MRVGEKKDTERLERQIQEIRIDTKHKERDRARYGKTKTGDRERHRGTMGDRKKTERPRQRIWRNEETQRQGRY